MESRRFAHGLSAIVLLNLLASQLLGADQAQRLLLQPRHKAHELTRVEVALQVGGDLKLQVDSKQKVLLMSVVANLAYDERVVELNRRARPSRTVRYYDDARAVIKVDKGGEKPTLAANHRLIGVEIPENSAPLLFTPTSALSREELDLIDVPGNSVLADDLLPEEAVAYGQSWKATDQALSRLLGLDAVSWTDVQCVLGETTEGVAEIAAAGSVSGAVGGVSTEIELKAKYRFDLEQRRVTYLALLIKEKRAIGHVGPGLDTVAKLIVKITPIQKSEHLDDAAVAKLPSKLTPELSQLGYIAAGGGFHFRYNRGWYVTSDDPKLAILRLVDRGELVAQCNLSALPVESQKPMTLAEFQQDVQKSLGANFGQFVTASESTNDAGYRVFRVVASGAVAKLPIQWIYYLVANEKGQRISLAFTFEQSLADRFEQADRLLVSQIRMTEKPTPTAAKAKEASAR